MTYSDWSMLLAGSWTTLWISGTAILLGVPFGLIIALLRGLNFSPLKAVLNLYVSLARATPLVTLVLFVFLGPPAFGYDIDKNVAAIAALTINTSAFNAEIWRNAVSSFSREQKEAAIAAGMGRVLMFRRIILPQIIITSLPALVSEMSFLIKTSPAVAVIGVVDLTRVTNRIAAVTYEPLPPIIAAGVIYMILIGIMIRFQRLADRYSQRLAM